MWIGRIIGAFVVVAGMVWIAQGLNLPLAPRSFMTADPSWAVIGSITVLVGFVVLDRSRRARR